MPDATDQELDRHMDEGVVKKKRLSRPAAAVVLAVMAMLLMSGCYAVGDKDTVKWRVREADHSVSHAEALQQAKPVIEAVTDAIDRLPGDSEWRALTVAPNDRDNRCGLAVRKNGTVEIDPTKGGFDDLGAAVKASAAPFGYIDLKLEGLGGPGGVFVDIADDDTMLRVGNNGAGQAWIEVYVPAHHDQCD